MEVGGPHDSSEGSADTRSASDAGAMLQTILLSDSFCRLDVAVKDFVAGWSNMIYGVWWGLAK